MSRPTCWADCNIEFNGLQPHLFYVSCSTNLLAYYNPIYYNSYMDFFSTPATLPCFTSYGNLALTMPSQYYMRIQSTQNRIIFFHKFHLGNFCFWIIFFIGSILCAIHRYWGTKMCNIRWNAFGRAEPIISTFKKNESYLYIF